MKDELCLHVWVIDLPLEEGGGPLLTHVVVRVPEVQPHLHVRLLLLGPGGEPLIAYPVQHSALMEGGFIFLHRFDKQFISSDFTTSPFISVQFFYLSES